MKLLTLTKKLNTVANKQLITAIKKTINIDKN